MRRRFEYERWGSNLPLRANVRSSALGTPEARAPNTDAASPSSAPFELLRAVLGAGDQDAADVLRDQRLVESRSLDEVSLKNAISFKDLLKF